MKKIIYRLFSIIAISLVLTACNNEEVTKTKKEAVNENNEVINPIGEIDAEITTYPFEESIKEADLIAEIEIIEKVRELNEPSAKTIFRAKITEQLKKDLKLESDDIHIMQQGNSEFIFNDNQMFQPGETYVLFLKNAIGITEENTYWILGEETGMYKEIDNKFFAKLSKRDQALANIENKGMSEELTKKEKNTKKKPKEIQVLPKKEFKEKIKRNSK